MSSPNYHHLAHLKLPLNDIISATDNFAHNISIRESDFGYRYKGQLMWSGELIHITAQRWSKEWDEKEQQFWMEIFMLSTLKHKNLVSLVGFCDENDEKVIIYKHETKGSLVNYLTDSKLLTWVRRLEICHGLAHALSYIHYDEQRDFSVIHRNIDSETVLLNDNWEPKLNEFRLSMKITKSQRHLSFDTGKVSNRLGYTDPTYLETKCAHHKSDTYSFGIVMFELLCSRKAVIDDDHDNKYLALVAVSHYREKKLNEMIDWDLWKQMDLQSFNIFKEIAYDCLNEERSKRPNIDEIVTSLEKALELQLEHHNAIMSSRMDNLAHLKLPLQSILSATDNFDDKNVIGSSGYEKRYRGELSWSDELIKITARKYNKDRDEMFWTEVSMHSSLKHQNLVSLLGFCDENGEKIIITRHEIRGSLSNHLSNAMLLTWVQRLKISVGLAHALSYIHYDEPRDFSVIHREISSISVLLNDNFEPKLSDFETSMKIEASQRHHSFHTSKVWSRNGCTDPTYEKTKSVNHKTDMYSFGIVLFELLCGRDLWKQIDSQSFGMFAEIAYDCLNDDLSQRPNIYEIVPRLEKALELARENRRISSYEKTKSVNHKTDMYSFGIVLFELLCARKSVIANETNKYLAPAAILYYKERKLNEIVDGDLWKQMDLQSFDIFAEIAYDCLNDELSQRPNIDEIVPRLEKVLELARENRPGARMQWELKLPLHSCSLPGSMNATQVSFWGGRLHFCEVGGQICKFGKPQGAYLQIKIKGVKKNRVKDSNTQKHSAPNHLAHLRIPFEDIESATNFFAQENVIGEGGFGKRYKGQLLWSGELIDINARRLINKEWDEKEQQFWTEISMLSSLKHKNVVSIVGFCNEVGAETIIYKHESRGWLEKYLSDPKLLTWVKRLEICVGVAHALRYIHYDEPRDFSVIHGKISSNTVQLNNDWEPKLSDFEHSMKIKASERHNSFHTDSAWSRKGYTDPTCLETNIVNQKSDIYSFGIVLFELLCCRDSVSVDQDNKYLAPVAIFHYREKIMDGIIDPDLWKQMNLRSLNIFAETAHECLNEEQSQRPNIDEIVARLEKALELQLECENAEHSSVVAEVGGTSSSHGEDSASHSTSTDVEYQFVKKTMSSLKYLSHSELSFEDIKSATNNFAPENAIREKTVKWVYQGRMLHSRQFIDIVARGIYPKYRKDESKKFRMEKSMLSSLNHPNLVSVVGFYDKNNRMITVYKKEANGSLNKYLSDETLTWMQRLKICLGTANALSYIHYDAGRDFSVIHCNIKSSKILLDNKWEPKLSGFELALKNTVPRRHRLLLTRDVIENVYLDPKYKKTGGMTHKSDVYSFGVVLFEVLCGRSAVLPDEKLGEGLLSKLVKSNLDDMIDPHLRKQMHPESLKIFSETAYCCVKEERADRPYIDQVVKTLEKAFELQWKHENPELPRNAVDGGSSNRLK
ncbi:kinase-like domain, phloem protein 2-like protein, partial [Tanacetum coccineum]